MVLSFSSYDLLPIIFDEIAKEFRRKEPGQFNRNNVLLGLITSLRLALEANSDAKSDIYAPLVTSDRFCTKWVTRDEIVYQIEMASGLDRNIAHIALLLMEARMDMALAISDVTVDDLFTFKLHKDGDIPKESLVQTNAAEWYEQKVFTILNNFGRDAGASYLRRWLRMPPAYLQAYTEALKLGAVFRKPVAYQIAFYRPEKSVEQYSPWKEVLPERKDEVQEKESFLSAASEAAPR